MTNYATMTQRIRECKTMDALYKASLSIERLYNAGIFTESQFMRLDGRWVEQSIRVEA